MNMKKNKNKKCKDCKMFKSIRFNIFKQDKDRPRVFTINCGLSGGKDYDASNCEYFKVK